ncbi:MAG: hypothetical protein QW292_10800 [Candidatus Parvarchaeota archaeon]
MVGKNDKESRNALKKFVRKMLQTNLVRWLSGISLKTAIYATAGTFSSLQQYLDDAVYQMSLFPLNFDNKMVMEFGSGLGRNLSAISNRIRFGIGIDINYLYVIQSRRLSKLLISKM